MNREHNELYRFRTGYLKFKSAVCDRNTGLLAYPLLLDEVRRFFETRDRVAVVVVRVTDLQRVESVYGWQACDQVLQQAAESLRRSIPEAMGSEALLAQDGVHLGRFVAFAPATREGEPVTALWASQVATDLQASLAAAFAAVDPDALAAGLHFSAGARLLTDNPLFRFERLVGHALDGALPLAVAEPDVQDEVELEMRRILRDGDLHVDYVPILTLSGRQVIGYEARVRGPVGTPLETPSVLFAYGEQYGLAGDLASLCRSRALETARPLSGGHMLFVNCLPTVLGDDAGLDEGLSQLMERTGCSPERMVLEVAETRLENGSRPAAATLTELRRLGMRLAMDRAGSGFATLKLIEELQPEYIKIEPTLIRGLESNLVQQDVARSLVQLAQRIGSQVVADGVESEAEAEAARRCGVLLVQGGRLAKQFRPAETESPENLPPGARTV